MKKSKKDTKRICGETPRVYQKDPELIERLKCRGPDYNSSITYVPDECTDTTITFHASVLWMQGDEPTSQPVVNETGILVYNGDVFDRSWDCKVSDTMQIMERLNGNACDVSKRNEHVIYVIAKLKGPFSIVYYDKLLKLLFFSRDAIGRNSLLCYSNGHSTIISSVLGRQYKGAIEIPASHIYSLHLENLTISTHERASLKNVLKCPLHEWITNIQARQSQPDDVFCSEAVEDSEPGSEDKDLIDFIERTSKETKCRRVVMHELLQNERIDKTVKEITRLLKESVDIRLTTQPQKCQDCVRIDNECKGHCTVGVLFSGGLDCSILALMADEYVPLDQPIDLINVAFNRDGGSFDVPDRMTGKLALEELRSLSPLRQWVFREVNVSQEELRREQSRIIADLVFPRQTILDESLGSALWFAARADDGTSSSCRILLLGSGADELFGGYTRHRNALRRKSWTGLHRELELDWRRISYRNLARDNRVTSHHARQARLPYLDEDFSEFVLKLKAWERCVPSESCEQGLGDKLFLRLTAFKLGLKNVSTLPKRALQFGSRIANKKENGADLSERFRNL